MSGQKCWLSGFYLMWVTILHCEFGGGGNYFSAEQSTCYQKLKIHPRNVVNKDYSLTFDDLYLCKNNVGGVYPCLGMLKDICQSPCFSWF